MFQSTPPHEGRQTATSTTQQFSCFNPRPRMRGDRTLGVPLSDVIKFQSTPPHEGRLQYRASRKRQISFQSTPPHEGRPGGVRQSDDLVHVSIHAPA